MKTLAIGSYITMSRYMIEYLTRVTFFFLLIHEKKFIILNAVDIT